MPSDRIASIAGRPVVWIPAGAGRWDANATTKNLIVVHDIEGTAQSAVETFGPDQQDGGSTQLISDPDNGRFVQMVGNFAVAYGAGNYEVNQRAVQIENPGYMGRPYSDAVVDYAAAAVGYWAREFNIPLRRLSIREVAQGLPGVCGHQDVPNPNNPLLGGGKDSHMDPGPTWPWDAMLRKASTYGGGVALPGGIAVPGGVPPVAGGGAVDGPRFFAEVGLSISHGFRLYWEAAGGLTTFGYPISREYRSDRYGGLVIQWFERARFEWHPGVSPDTFDVLLGRVGAELLDVVSERADNPDAFAREG